MEEISKKTGKTKQNRGYIEKKKHFSCMIKKKAVPLHPQIRNNTAEWSSWSLARLITWRSRVRVLPPQQQLGNKLNDSVLPSSFFQVGRNSSMRYEIPPFSLSHFCLINSSKPPFFRSSSRLRFTCSE